MAVFALLFCVSLPSVALGVYLGRKWERADQADLHFSNRLRRGSNQPPTGIKPQQPRNPPPCTKT